MTDNMSTYLRNKLVNHTWRNTGYTTPGTSIYLSLHDGDPGPTGANEVSGGSYARLQVTAWDAPALRATQNTNDVTFTTLTVDLGTATNLGIWDASTSGNFLFKSDAFALPLVVGSAPQFEAGQIIVTIGGNASTYLAHKWLSHVLRNTAFTSPGTSIYVSAHTGDPGVTGAAEISGNNYARKQVTAWSAPSNGLTRNTSIIQFNTPSANWGTINGSGSWDASSSGNFLGGGVISSPYAALSGDTTIAFGASEFNLFVE